jgi:hypothetical protein
MNKKAIIFTSIFLGAGLGVAVYFIVKNNVPIKLTDQQVKSQLISYILIDKGLIDIPKNRAMYEGKTIDELKSILAE